MSRCADIAICGCGWRHLRARVRRLTYRLLGLVVLISHNRYFLIFFLSSNVTVTLGEAPTEGQNILLYIGQL